MVISNEEHGFTRCMRDIWLAFKLVSVVDWTIFFQPHGNEMMAICINIIKI